MKKILYILILGAALMTPERKLDIGKLLPVEVVMVDYADGQVQLETDTGEIGVGIGIAAALENLEDTAAGVIYLDTAEHLLITQEAWQLLPDLMPYLKADMGVYLAREKMDLTGAAEYLAVHKSPVTLEDIRAGGAVPEIVTNGKSFLTGK